MPHNNHFWFNLKTKMFVFEKVLSLIMLSAKVMDKERNSFPSCFDKETISSQLVMLFLFSYHYLYRLVKTVSGLIISQVCVKYFDIDFFYPLRLSPNNEICREYLFISSSKNAADDVF